MISVLMSVYNEELDWIKASVESILKQTYSNFEFIIIIDNPQISDICRNYLESIRENDSRVILHYNSQNIGLMNSLNVGIDLAQGEYIARMDADDISVSQRFEIELDYLKKNGFDMVSSNRININEVGEEISRGTPIVKIPHKHLPYNNFIVHPSVMVKTSVLRELNGYRKFHNSEDYDMWLRILSDNYLIGIIDKYLIYYRVRSNSMSYKNKLEQYYIAEYQKQLYWERIRTGKDSFSEENLNKFLNKKNITVFKNIRYIYMRDRMDKAIMEFKKKDWHFIFHILLAFICYPSIVCKNIRIIICTR